MLEIKQMTEKEIVKEAQRRGYGVEEKGQDYRVWGSKLVAGSDEWMNAANNRLFEIEQMRGGGH